MRIRVRINVRRFSPTESNALRAFVLGLTSAVLATISGCQAQATKIGSAEAPVVPVGQPVKREVTDYVDFTGRTESIYPVDIRPRVTGYLVDMPFQEGEEVKAGDVLFIVDPRPYKAQLDQAQGQVDLYQASLKLAKTTLKRDRAINSSSRGSVSQQQFDQEQAVVDEAEARVKAFQKSMEIYRLSYEFTRVVAPIDGQISRYYLTRGNLVNQDQTLLTTIVSVDPMYVYFEMDEPTLLRTRKAVNEGKIKPPEKGTGIPVTMALQGEEGFPHPGTINFVNNQVNPATGSILVRGVFPNPVPKKGRRLLSPGMFVRIRLPIGQTHPALLVVDRAIGSDQGLKFVYVLDAENKAQYRRVTTGAPQDGGLRVIEQGLEPDDWVVFGGLQQVRPRMTVRPERATMLASGQSDESKKASRSGESKKAAKTAPPMVPVSLPVQREVTNFVDFTARTEAVHSVDIRSRVTGYLTKMPFAEGEEVKEGDLLFIVDPRPYKAQLDQAQGQVDLYQASLKLAKTTLARDRAINALQPGSVSQQQFDIEQATVDEADARVKAFEKSREVANLSHAFTRVISPIDGQISRYYQPLGNLVNQDQTLLTTVVSVDPMYVFFEMDEPTLLRTRKAVNEGKIKVPDKGVKMPVLMGLQGEDGFPHQGTINFVNNQVNPATGSILVRGVFPNHRPKGGHRLLSPGMFVRVRQPIGQPYSALLVIDRAVGSDQQGLKYVYVLDKNNTAQTRHVATGPLQDDGLRVIEQGLKPDDLVIVGALQQVRVGDDVKPEKVPMPSFGQPNAADHEALPDQLKNASSSGESKKAMPSPGESKKAMPSPGESKKATPSPGESKKATPSPSEPTKH
jgi:membrane fusion protein, multidrug efflux system